MAIDHIQPKEIVFFKSSLCPRCLLASRVLARLQKQYPQLRVRQIDVLLHPVQTVQNGILMIPALKAGDETLTMLLPRADEITSFVEKFLGE